MNRVFCKDQCTIQWHADDLKISCRNESVGESVLKKLSMQYGKISPLAITRGKVHDYIGMRIDYSQGDKVLITQYDYINEILMSLPDDMKGTAVQPARKYLFTVNKDTIKLDVKTADLFHHYTAQLLFLSKHAMLDLQTAIAFLCTRIVAPDIDDYKKLANVIKYPQTYQHLSLILDSD